VAQDVRSLSATNAKEKSNGNGSLFRLANMFGKVSGHPIGFLMPERNTVALKITDREVDGAYVVALDGRIVLGEESQALRVKLKSLVAEGKKKVVLNMDNIKYIDSAGLGILVAAHVSAKLQGASLKLSNLGSKFREVLQITKLFTVFDVYNTEAAAVASFSK
jgi:anti-sigma B factor antagonist